MHFKKNRLASKGLNAED